MGDTQENGDARFEALYRRYGPVIFARCRRLLMDTAAAEDATQEVFLRVYRHLDRLADGDRALPWIYRVSTNYCLNQKRNRVTREQATPRLPRYSPTALEDVLASRDLVDRLLRRAPEKLRACVLLHHVEGFDQGDVAATLGISRRTVINRLQAFVQWAERFMARDGVSP